MAEQDQNRNEAATPHRKEEARKKGNVAKSLDVNSFVVLAVFLISMYIWAGKMLDEELLLAKNILNHTSHMSFEVNEVSAYLSEILAKSLTIIAPFFILLFIFGVLATFMQVGPVFSFFPLKPDFSKINPVTGFKRLFSIKLLIEAIKTVLKFVLLGTVLYFVIKNVIPKMLASFHLTPSSMGLLLMPKLNSMLFKLLLVLLLIAAIDLIFTRWDYAKKLRMSRRDITDEHKRREGDPRIKSRLRELQRETLKRAKSLGRVKDADVLITNPTHFAIAIKYNKDDMDVPQVLAKGAGFMAARMKDIARIYRIPIVENRTLARGLFRDVEIEGVIPMEYYSTVAKVLFWVYSLKGLKVNKK
ncbi:MAG TPA: flagellar biosynthesis protein FlhB [Methylotenera sp.]|nr:flagellar biosynthesis protein FlhB [Methylotenera sp.]